MALDRRYTIPFIFNGTKIKKSIIKNNKKRRSFLARRWQSN